mgnify:CR=1 FL=1
MLKNVTGIQLNEWERSKMNDAVLFTMLYVQQLIKQGDRINCRPDQISQANRLYDKFCETFYKGTRWEYDTPDYTELVLGMDEFISKNI